MHHGGCSRGDLIVVERCKDVSRIAAVNSVSILIEHVDIDKVGPGIHPSVLIQRTTLAKYSMLIGDLDVHPYLVGIGGSLRKKVAQLEGSNHHFEEVGRARLQLGNFRPDWRCQGRIHRTSFFETEQLDLDVTSVESLVGFLNPFGRFAKVGNPRVGSRKQVIVNLELATVIHKASSKVLGRLGLHVAAVAVALSLWGEVEGPGIAPRDTTEQKTVVMILPPQPIFVMGQFPRKAHLVASRTEGGILVKGFEESLFVQGRLGLDHLLVGILQHGMLTFGKRVMDRLLERVGCVALGAVHVGDGMADRAGDAGVSCGVVSDIECWVVKSTAEKRNHVMTTCTPA